MIFKDAKQPRDTIKATLREEAHGDLIDIEIQEDEVAGIYLDKESARKLGEYLIKLSETIPK